MTCCKDIYIQNERIKIIYDKIKDYLFNNYLSTLYFVFVIMFHYFSLVKSSAKRILK